MAPTSRLGLGPLISGGESRNNNHSRFKSTIEGRRPLNNTTLNTYISETNGGAPFSSKLTLDSPEKNPTHSRKRLLSARFKEISELSKSPLLLMFLVHAVPVREVVAAYKKKKNIWGIEGYDLPKFDVNFDKVRKVKMIKDNRPSFLDEAVKIKKFVPEPTLYEVSGNLINSKKKSGLCKGKRIMMSEEIEIYEKKN